MSSALDPAIPRRLLLLGQGMLENRYEKASPARIHKRIEGLGMATPSEIAAHYRCVSLREARSWCQQGLADGRLVQVEVAALDGSNPRSLMAFPTWKRRWKLAEKRLTAIQGSELRLLSPFDPILRDRKRASRLFGFDYRFEAFVPAARRQYGYYALPLLLGERLVGRLDAKFHRDQSLLEVRGLWWEHGFLGRRAPLRALRSALDSYREFLGAEAYRLPRGDLRSCQA